MTDLVQLMSVTCSDAVIAFSVLPLMHYVNGFSSICSRRQSLMVSLAASFPRHSKKSPKTAEFCFESIFTY